jgi:hypothetical protein
MKSKQLRRLVREAIKEVLSETTELDVENAKKAALDLKMKYADAERKAADTEKQLATAEKTALGELARIAKGYQLTKDNIDTAPFANKKVSGIPLTDIIEYFREHPGTEKAQLQKHFNFVRPQITNALVNALTDAGVLVKVGEPEVSTTEPGEEEQPSASVATEPEDMFVGGNDSDVLSMYFDKEPNANGEEDFDDNVEPGIGDIEKTSPMTAANISDEDFEASLKYSELERRLANTKSNITKLKKSRPTVGDIKDKPSDELVRLRDLRASLEKRIADLIASSDYVKKMATGKPTTTLEPVDLGNEEEPLDEWIIGKWQYYAGIKK